MKWIDRIFKLEEINGDGLCQIFSKGAIDPVFGVDGAIMSEEREGYQPQGQIDKSDLVSKKYEPERYQEYQMQVYLCLQLISTIPLEGLVEAQSDAVAIGPFTDPTAWRANHKKLSQDHEAALILLHAKQTFEKLQKENSNGR